MADRKTPAHGEFCWMELASSNVEACKPFYTELFGWNIANSSSVAEFDYFRFGTKPENTDGGMMQMTAEFGDMPSHWQLYVAVDDVDEAARKAFDLGGKICVPPHDIPNVGRFSVINDPSGAMISMITFNQQGKENSNG